MLFVGDTNLFSANSHSVDRYAFDYSDKLDTIKCFYQRTKNTICSRGDSRWKLEHEYIRKYTTTNTASDFLHKPNAY